MRRRAADVGRERREPETEPGRLEFGHPEVLGDRLVHVLLRHPVAAQPAHLLGERCVVGDHSAAVTDAAEVLRRVEGVRDGGRDRVGPRSEPRAWAASSMTAKSGWVAGTSAT